MTKVNWCGGEHEFALRIGELRALQSKCDAGPEFILLRLSNAQYFIDDVVETIRLGLIGGGMPPDAAAALVNKLVDQAQLVAMKATAYQVLASAILPPTDEELPDLGGDKKKANEESGDSLTSTPQAL
jgi:hypothetical protein